MIRDLHNLDKAVVRTRSGNDQPLLRELLPIGIIELEPVAMTLTDLSRIVPPFSSTSC